MKRIFSFILFSGIVALFLIAGAPKALASSSFYGTKVIVKTPGGTFLNNVRVDLTSPVPVSATWPSATYGSQGCDSDVSTARPFVNLNGPGYTLYQKIAGLQTGNAYTYNGKYYDNGDGHVFFGDGVHSTSGAAGTSTDYGMGFGFACSCRPLYVTVYIKDGWFYDPNRNGVLDSGEIKGPGSITTRVGIDSLNGVTSTVSNGSLGTFVYFLSAVPTSTATNEISASVAQLSTTGVADSVKTYSNSGFPDTNVDPQFNYQWQVQTSTDGNTWTALPNVTATKYSANGWSVGDRTYFPRRHDLTALQYETPNQITIPGFNPERYYRLFLVACYPGLAHGQASCHYVDPKPAGVAWSSTIISSQTYESMMIPQTANGNVMAGDYTDSTATNDVLEIVDEYTYNPDSPPTEATCDANPNTGLAPLNIAVTAAPPGEYDFRFVRVSPPTPPIEEIILNRSAEIFYPLPSAGNWRIYFRPADTEEWLDCDNGEVVTVTNPSNNRGGEVAP